MNLLPAINMQNRKIAPDFCIRAVLLTGLMFMLSACAAVSQYECAEMQWHEQGVIIGTQGLAESEARREFEGCGVGSLSTADRNAYIQGYRAGINDYCTKENGFQVGVEGAIYQDVCPEDTEESFLIGYRAGSELFLANYDLRASKIAFASAAAPSSFIGTPPSVEHNRFRLETFPQTRDTARALISQSRWSQPQAPMQTLRRSYGKRDLTTAIKNCEDAMTRAEEKGFVVDDDVC